MSEFHDRRVIEEQETQITTLRAERDAAIAEAERLRAALKATSDAIDEVSNQCVKYGINGIGNIGGPAREAARTFLKEPAP